MASCSFTLSVFMALLSTVHTDLFGLCGQMNYYAKSKNLFHCFKYMNYGCWCGPGGSGKPVDAIDSCCKNHDYCYEKLIKKISCNPYMDDYNFLNGICGGETRSCSYKSCVCDQVFSKCIRRHNYQSQFDEHRNRHLCKSVKTEKEDDELKERYDEFENEFENEFEIVLKNNYVRRVLDF